MPDIEIYYCPFCRNVHSITEGFFKKEGSYYKCKNENCNRSFRVRNLLALKRIQFNEENLVKIDKHIERLSKRGYSPNKIASELFLRETFVYKRLEKNNIKSSYKYKVSNYKELVIKDIDKFLFNVFKKFTRSELLSTEKLVQKLNTKGFSKKLIYRLMNDNFFYITDDNHISVDKVPNLVLLFKDDEAKNSIEVEFKEELNTDIENINDILIELNYNGDPRIKVKFKGFIKVRKVYDTNVLSYDKIQFYINKNVNKMNTVFKLTKEKYIQINLNEIKKSFQKDSVNFTNTIDIETYVYEFLDLSPKDLKV